LEEAHQCCVISERSAISGVFHDAVEIQGDS